MALRIQHDLWYIQNGSLWLDLKILLMTPLVLVHRNAYLGGMNGIDSGASPTDKWVFSRYRE